MSNVISFRPRAGLQAEEQVREFIEWAKGLSSFDKSDLPLDWNAWSWKLWMNASSDFVKLGVKSKRTSFDPSKDLLDPKIIDFAKAYTLYKQSLNKTAEINEIVVIRAVEAALLELESRADITLLNTHVYDRAGEIIREHFSPQKAYRHGQKLQILAEFISQKGLSVSNDIWVNFIKRPNDAYGHVRNKEAAKKKIPTQEALDALAEIWSAQPTDHRDIFVTSNCALLLCSPGRVGELNVLAADCVTYKDNRDGKPELFINWYGQKGFGFSDKAVPEIWKDFTLESIRRLKEIMEEPRKLAKRLEEYPDEFPIYEGCPNVDQDTPLTFDQVIDVIRVSPGHSVRKKVKWWLKNTLETLNKKPLWIKSKAILQEQLDNMYEGRPSKDKVDTFTLTLRKLNILLRERWLPKHFPYTDESKKMKYQDALNCYFEGQLHSGGCGFMKPYSLQQISSNTLNNSLSFKVSDDPRYENLNLFRRWGYKTENHTMTTHQFRHYLNTIAAKGQVGEIERARWSGRLDVSQNKVYNHISDEERVENARSLGLGSQSTGLAQLTSKHQPILLTDLGVAEDRVAHYTEYGVCVHDFAVEPCTKFRDCLTCKKHKCIKGDEEKERRIRMMRDGLVQTLKQATHGVEQEFYGADRWLAYSMGRLEKANALIEILENPETADGAVIACTDNGYSALDKGLAAQGKLPKTNAPRIESNTSKPQADLHKLAMLLGK